MDVRNGSSYPVFDVKRGSGRGGRFTYPDQAARRYGDGPPTNVWTADRSGTLVATSGHLRSGGLWTDLSIDRDGRRPVRLFCSRARYFEPAGPVSWDVSMTVHRGGRSRHVVDTARPPVRGLHVLLPHPSIHARRVRGRRLSRVARHRTAEGSGRCSSATSPANPACTGQHLRRDPGGQPALCAPDSRRAGRSSSARCATWSKACSRSTSTCASCRA